MNPQRLMLLSFILWDGFLWVWAIYGMTPAVLTASLFTSASLFIWGFVWWTHNLGRDRRR